MTNEWLRFSKKKGLKLMLFEGLFFEAISFILISDTNLPKGEG
jgi:hypothetical protein